MSFPFALNVHCAFTCFIQSQFHHPCISSLIFFVVHFKCDTNWCVHLYLRPYLLFVLMVSDMWHIIFFKILFFCVCVKMKHTLCGKEVSFSRVYEMSYKQNIWKNFFFMCISSLLFEVLYVSYAMYETARVCMRFFSVLLKENRFWLFLMMIIVIQSKCT